MIEFHRLARAELKKAHAWYRMKSREAAGRFLVRVDQAIERLSHDPSSFPVIEREYRYVRVSRFPYVLVFRVRNDGTVFVYAVAHTSRRAGYWRRRR